MSSVPAHNPPSNLFSSLMPPPLCFSIMCSLESLVPNISQISHLQSATHSRGSSWVGKIESMMCLIFRFIFLAIELSIFIPFMISCSRRYLPVTYGAGDRSSAIASVALYELVCEWNIECCLKSSSEADVAECGSDIKQQWSLNWQGMHSLQPKRFS